MSPCLMGTKAVQLITTGHANSLAFVPDRQIARLLNSSGKSAGRTVRNPVLIANGDADVMVPARREFLSWPADPAATRKRVMRTALNEIVVRKERPVINLVLHWKRRDHTALQVTLRPMLPAGTIGRQLRIR